MSRWLRLVDDLKRQAGEDSLTPSQRQVWQTLCDWLRFPQRINLWGPPGSGKTYVAWALARSLAAAHVPLPEKIVDLEPDTEIVLVDNAPDDEVAVRRLWARCNLLGVRSVVMITRAPVAIPLRAILLAAPTREDRRQVSRTLMRLGYRAPSPDAECPSLWDYLRQSI